ncbi:MAG TPA: lipopolysaccharide heptosyltransferase I [Accumulibacter sp.]|nr:lipopolysaccharide heptosyltransferase I [Accumulibacter sp.]HMW16640.1 lipopolysaccharide heptosyltransferase I [Accumulibacter sp.]HMY06785.1 lipopolysaccharide heptosyltransferase I [Accumulibacter sp.]HNC16709.1 lipopolysaccharide heptosyltransferase I [Accumulibacter sp.]HND79318.1 lipopolysaccharide heptosyltransferase I [Accumulibacter sp.]
MRILLIKTTSLGDVIHNLPVISDLRASLPASRIDWCVEETFAEIPRLHPAVEQVIPVAIRRWRKTLAARATWREIIAFRRRIAAVAYDCVLDTQGLLKSALIARLARGRRCGYAAEAAREPWAARCYDATFVIPRNVHAVLRNRWLAAAAFDYPVDLPLDYGLSAAASAAAASAPAGAGDRAGPVAVLLTATSREDKLWDERCWCALALALVERGLMPVLPAGTAVERQRAERIVNAVPGTRVAPPLSLTELAALLAGARVVVGVDTGLVHLAAALRVPVVALFTATDPELTGVLGAGFCRNLGGKGQAPTVAEVLPVVDQALR